MDDQQNLPPPSSLATVFVACKLLQYLDEIRHTYPGALDQTEANDLQDQLIWRLELCLDGEYFKDFREAYKRPDHDAPFSPEIGLIMNGALAHGGVSPDLPQADQKREYDELARRWEKEAMDPIKSVTKRIQEVQVFNCRCPDPNAQPRFRDPRRTLYLLAEYWSVIRQIVVLERKAYTYHIPHPMLPVIVSLRERVEFYFVQLQDTPDAQEAKESMIFFLDVLASGQNDDLQAKKEYTNRQLAAIQLFLEKTRVSLGRKAFPLTFAEDAFLRVARWQANKYVQDTTAARELATTDLAAVNEKRAMCEARTDDRTDEESEPEIVVSISPPQVTIGKFAYALTDLAATFMDALVKAGDWVSGQSITDQPSRVKSQMPKEVQKVIEAAPGKGFRIRPRT